MATRKFPGMMEALTSQDSFQDQMKSRGVSVLRKGAGLINVANHTFKQWSCILPPQVIAKHVGTGSELDS